MVHEFDYDLAVIGTGPAGQRAAIQAAKLRRRVAIIERRDVVGGICINTGTIPSKALREAVLYLRGIRERNFYGASYSVKPRIAMSDLLARCDHVMRNEIDVVRSQLERNGVDVIAGDATFVDPHTLRIASAARNAYREITAARVVIACGTIPADPPDRDAGTAAILTSDEVLRLDEIPRSLAVVGAGVIGVEYAAIFAALGVKVTLIDARDELLPFVDREMTQALTYHLRDRGVVFRLGERVERMTPDEAGLVHVFLGSGKQIVAEKVLYSIGRIGATGSLQLEQAGLATDGRGRVKVNDFYQTDVPHIYAAGDVIGFPSLASTSMEQGRLAACHALGVRAVSNPEHFPYGIYAVPEISMVGPTEEQLTEEGIPYEAGVAHYREIARGQLVGDVSGTLKLLFHQGSGELLGAHIIGDGAAELIHIGQTVLAFKGTVDYFVNTVFNYPTLAECYKVAAFDAVNRMNALAA
jgi:NAD(P) transhydrogenase